jgi:hypothetical protein
LSMQQGQLQICLTLAFETVDQQACGALY